MTISRITLPTALRSNLLTLQRTQNLIDRTTLRLATGLKLNSALDNPQNFFAARELGSRASDLERRLDGISQSIRVIREASVGVEHAEQLLQQAKAIAQTELEKLKSGETVAEVKTVTPLSTQILSANPAAYWRLNETGSATATNLGSLAGVDGTYLGGPTLGSAALYDAGATSVDFNGTNQGISIPDSAGINTGTYTQRTVELVFNADDTVSRQVLYEEGSGTNAFSIYVLNGRVYVVGRDAGAWGPPNISAPINAGETYHAAFTFNSIDGEFIGYLNGQSMGSAAVNATFPSHNGNIGIGFTNDGTWFHDGSEGASGRYFNGRISDVALYNDTLSAAAIDSHAESVMNTIVEIDENEQFNEAMDQLTALVQDAHYRSYNMLNNDNLTTFFNEDGSSTLTSEGVDFTENGLSLLRNGFNSIEGIEAIIERVDAAINEVRSFASTLAIDLNILQIREDFTQNTINTLIAGQDDLRVVDQNEEGSNLLALQTRQQLGVTALSLAAQSTNSVLNLFA